VVILVSSTSWMFALGTAAGSTPYLERLLRRQRGDRRGGRARRRWFRVRQRAELRGVERIVWVWKVYAIATCEAPNPLAAMIAGSFCRIRSRAPGWCRRCRSAAIFPDGDGIRELQDLHDRALPDGCPVLSFTDRR